MSIPFKMRGLNPTGDGPVMGRGSAHLLTAAYMRDEGDGVFLLQGMIKAGNLVVDGNQDGSPFQGEIRVPFFDEMEHVYDTLFLIDPQINMIGLCDLSLNTVKGNGYQH